MKDKKYTVKIDKKENSKSNFPTINISVQEYTGEILKFGEYIDTQVFKMFRKYCETLEAFSAEEAVFKADDAMYKDTLRCISNFVIMHPDSSAYDVMMKMQEKENFKKKILLSRNISVEEMFFIHVDDMMFPAQSMYNYMTGVQEVKMVNSCLVKRVILDVAYFEGIPITSKELKELLKTEEGRKIVKEAFEEEMEK